MTTIDFDRARSFIAAVPEARWTAYKDVAEAGGNARGAQAVGDWLRREGDRVACVYRVLTVDGAVPDAFRPAGPGVPADAASVREQLTAEGVVIDVRGRASQQQRFKVGDWADAKSLARRRRRCRPPDDDDVAHGRIEHRQRRAVAGLGHRVVRTRALRRAS